LLLVTVVDVQKSASPQSVGPPPCSIRNLIGRVEFSLSGIVSPVRALRSSFALATASISATPNGVDDPSTRTLMSNRSVICTSSSGWRIRYAKGGKRTFVDGPFTETKELIAGYTLIQVKSREEAVEWARRFPNPAGEGKEGEIEVRQFFELEDFGPSEAVERFRAMGVGPRK